MPAVGNAAPANDLRKTGVEVVPPGEPRSETVAEKRDVLGGHVACPAIRLRFSESWFDHDHYPISRQSQPAGPEAGEKMQDTNGRRIDNRRLPGMEN